MDKYKAKLKAGNKIKKGKGKNTPKKKELKNKEPIISAVALGDSWFDYPPAKIVYPNGDLIKQVGYLGYKIKNFGKLGDTLENMVYGTKIGPPKRCNPYSNNKIDKVLARVKKQKPAVFLMSGGGNDVSGIELESYLNHKESGLPLLRKDYADYVLRKTFKRYYQHLIKKVLDASPNTHIFIHGYGYSIPNGSYALRSYGGWISAGPWLRPAFMKNRITDDNQMKRIIKSLIDRFNQTLSEVAKANKQVHYIDLRDLIVDKDWSNEMHLTVPGWKKVAKKFDAEIRAVLYPPPH